MYWTTSYYRLLSFIHAGEQIVFPLDQANRFLLFLYVKLYNCSKALASYLMFLLSQVNKFPKIFKYFFHTVFHIRYRE